MKLTYRGIRYKSQTAATDTGQSQHIISCKYRLSDAQDSNKLILIRPINYYTYRGISYTKNLVFDTQTKLLLDIDRQ
ncbi:MAG: DUF4278 domain-containing protein [Cyanobacteria bacterium P01_A01_bin.40]